MKNLLTKSSFTAVLIFILFSGILSATENKNLTDVSSIKNELSDIEDSFAAVEAKYISPLLLESDVADSYSQKIEKGDSYFNRKDYINAGTIYYSVLANRTNKDVIWEELTYKMAESLFLNGNYISAVQYYDSLITEKPYTRYLTHSLKRLITASYYLGEFQKAKEYYTQFLEMGYDISQDNELIYLLGKALFFDQQYEDAVKVFKAVDSGSPYFPQALYFIGAYLTMEQEYKESLSFFESILKLEERGNVYKDYEEIKELSVLAMGRVSFEMGNYSEALSYYLKIKEKSEHFAEAYYELCWTYIKRGEMEKAIEALRLVRLIAPDSILAPKAALLEGNVLIKMKRYGEATVVFDKIVNEYGDINRRLQELKLNKSSYESYKINNSDESGFFTVSPIVKKIFDEDRHFAYSYKIESSLKDLENELVVTERLKSKLESIVSNENVASIFPPLKKGTETAVGYENRITAIVTSILAMKKELSWKDLSEEEKARFDALEKERLALAERIKNMPKSDDEFESFASAHVNNVLNTEAAIHRLSIHSLNTISILDSIKKYYDKEKNGVVDSKIMEKLDQEKSYTESIFENINKKKIVIEEEKDRIRLGGEIISRMILDRDAYDKIVQQQKELLNNHSGGNPELMMALDSLNERAEKDSVRIEKFRNKLNLVVSGKIKEIKQAFDQEKMNVNNYKSQIAVLKTELAEIRMKMVLSGVSKVRGTFSDVVLKADVGIIDVAWEKKEASTTKLTKYRKDMSEEIRQLYLSLENLE